MHVVSPFSWRGGEQQVVFLYEELQKLGVFQLLVCPKGSATEKYCRKHNFNYQALKKRAGIDFIFARQMHQLCVKERINLLHPHDSHAHTFSVLSKVIFKNPADIILQRRVDFPVSKSWFSRFKYNHPSIKRILCVSQAIADVMRPDINQPEKITVVHDGIDLHKFDKGNTGILRNEYGIPPELPIVGNVAALVQQKDYFTFLDTAALLAEKGLKARFVCIGEGTQKDTLIAYAEEKKIADKVIFTGFRTDIDRVLPEFDVLLFSSEMEGLGTTILDAYAAGVPVVSTNAGGIPEVILHKQTGYLGEVKNPGSLAKGVQAILSDKTLAERLKKEGKAFVQNFSTRQTALKTLAVYREVLA